MSHYTSTKIEALYLFAKLHMIWLLPNLPIYYLLVVFNHCWLSPLQSSWSLLRMSYPDISLRYQSLLQDAVEEIIQYLA